MTLMATLQVAEARITKISITHIESPTFGGRAFGSVGPYEKLVGTVEGEVDPADPHNSVITDLARAPHNANGKVGYATDIMIFRPIDRSKGNHKVWYELTNRGNVLAFPQFNDAASGGNDPSRAADAGNGFLMRQGYSILFSGWDISARAGGNRFTMKAPIAVNADGSPIVGPAMEEFVIDDNQTMIGPLTYPAATVDKSAASLTMRERYHDEPYLVPAYEWDFANAAGTSAAGESRRGICRADNHLVARTRTFDAL